MQMYTLHNSSQSGKPRKCHNSQHRCTKQCTLHPGVGLRRRWESPRCNSGTFPDTPETAPVQVLRRKAMDTVSVSVSAPRCISGAADLSAADLSGAGGVELVEEPAVDVRCNVVDRCRNHNPCPSRWQDDGSWAPIFSARGEIEQTLPHSPPSPLSSHPAPHTSVNAESANVRPARRSHSER